MPVIYSEKTCINCGHVGRRNAKKYCSVTCQWDYTYKENIKLWLAGKRSGMRGQTATALWIKRYMIETYGEKCMECEWAERNPFTGNIPIELEHIDGNFRNNKKKNLKLLCPNCHSLTKTYKGANKGGRPRGKYYLNERKERTGSN